MNYVLSMVQIQLFYGFAALLLVTAAAAVVLCCGADGDWPALLFIFSSLPFAQFSPPKIKNQI